MLYSGHGDDGQTTLFGRCKKLSKSSQIIEALGSIDELNSLLGLCRCNAVKQKEIFITLKDIQNDLFIIQAELSGSDKKIGTKKIEKIERTINKIEKKLPKIKGFIVAGESELSSLLDYARAVARRAERRIAPLKKYKLILKYLNRLSSLLFALARLANKNKGVKESHPRY